MVCGCLQRSSDVTMRSCGASVRRSNETDLALVILIVVSFMAAPSLSSPCSNPDMYLELSKIKAPRPKCKKLHNEWGIIALAAAEPNVDRLLNAMPKRGQKLEILASLKSSGPNAAAAGAKLNGPNHFAVFHTLDFSRTTALNRLVQMANAEVVILMLPGQELVVTNTLIAAQAEFAARPNLGLLSFGHGYMIPEQGSVANHGSKPETSPGKFTYCGAGAWDQPIAVRRKAFLEVGGLSEQVCGGTGVCEGSASVDLSARMWEGGYTVALQTLNSTSHKLPCENPVHMAKLSPDLISKAAAARDTQSPNATRVSITNRMPIAACSKAKAPASQCPGAGSVDTSIILQFFRRGKNIKKIMHGIKQTASNAEVLINNDSRSDFKAWNAHLSGLPNGGIIIYSPNIHEIRGYNRLAKLAAGKLLVFTQDDDAPQGSGWLKAASNLFAQHRDLQLLGGLRGRLDLGRVMDPKYNYINGPKYGPPSEARNCCEKIPTIDGKTGQKFMYVYKVNMGPMLAPRSSFLASGMYSIALSCPGDPGIGFDFEYSIRMWFMGYSVGLYDSKFKQDIGDHEKSGTRSNSKMYSIRRDNEMRNNKLMYSMYKGFHHTRGTKKAMAKLATLKKSKGWKMPNEKGATSIYIKQVLLPRGKSSGGGASKAAAAAKKAGLGNLIKG